MTTGTLKTMLQNNDGSEFSALGYIVWWNIRGVKVQREVFKNSLNAVGLDGDRYARPHNYRASFIRCLKSLEEQRIIRQVMEDENYIVYQFTAETLIDDPENPYLEYTPELTVKINKRVYFDEGEFSQALECEDKIKEVLVPLFVQEQNSYTSSDLTRYVQKIFRTQGDMLPLRQQGAVYFVPATYEEVVMKVSTVMNDLNSMSDGTAKLDFFPVPDVQSARNMVSDGVESEVAGIFSKMEDEITKVRNKSDEITDRWIETRQDRINNVRKRLDLYADVLGEAARDLNGDCDRLLRCLHARKLDI